ncbi:N(5)-(carboxyethyl)ornithine synthase [Listeria booriae]|uniref:N(5)-(Carboxyethyl)ornithine synthase n=2 Tax=Listeria booriae TaxID=1552123 RepID=A0A7X0XI79_9LIST|nr:N(5)-(carboxyethyl)ornithine synthase [Listeria booriae]MBC1574089.1 N(5)-(carboxyethyl)ornithine synthase [Listeria booriae]MBC2103566.1 N(5)-(carboxyethyl)ornithine synthase [Listeria booriae]MBC2321814.1 N(5)-(carboxyethyl)ornithine synthase [Listeria booriae]
MEPKKKTMGFIVSHKENERRIALLPEQLPAIRNTNQLYFEEGYGLAFGIADAEYATFGCHMKSRKEVLCQDIICEPKIGDAEFLSYLKKGQTIFGWIHAEQSEEIAQKILRKKIKVYAWENMNYMNRHCFWVNNELGGEGAIIHAFQIIGETPCNMKVAILGRGNVSHGAQRVLLRLGADVYIYSRNQECLFKEEIGDYDVIVNAVLWDLERTGHIIYKEDLKRMKKNAVIIDVSCDEAGAIETSKPTTIENPTYLVDDILHYVVDHTPSLLYRTASKSISAEISKYVDDLIESKYNSTLEATTW